MNNQMLDILTGQLFPAREARRNEWRWLLLGLGLGDALCVAGGFILAYLLRFFTDWAIFYPGDARIGFYTMLIVLLVPSWVALFTLYGLYNYHIIFGGTTEYAHIFNACTVGLLVIVVLTFLQPDFVIARGWLLLAWASVSGMVIGWRFIARRMVYSLRERGHLIQRSVVLGANAEGQAVARQLNASRKAGVQVVGFVDDHLAPGTEVLPGVPVLGPVTAFEAIVTHTGVDSAIIADTEMVRERLPAVCGAMEALRRLDVSLAPGIFELLTVGVEVRERGSVPLLGLNKTRITGLHAVGKAIIDQGGALVALILLSPLLALVAVLVRLDSPGPIIYRRRVVGVGNRTFDAFKFRTMRVDGEKLLTPELRKELNETGKLQNDPRITRLGRFLRRTSIDELPQLVNVLLGQMSLVGPRMITTDELRHFGRWRHNLVTVRPGLTGLWQISGRSNLGYEERVRLDMHYIRNYSIWLDLYIIYRTIAVVISGHGAY